MKWYLNKEFAIPFGFGFMLGRLFMVFGLRLLSVLFLCLLCFLWSGT